MKIISFFINENLKFKKHVWFNDQYCNSPMLNYIEFYQDNNRWMRIRCIY